ncbi:MAG: DUF6665 family protein [Phenylobacterium sp.]|uniref:DUF6665 family protein n=1 Tax=Phenylobacterium sp. TaxID=1871053 RepID=UPI00391D4DBA
MRLPQSLGARSPLQTGVDILGVEIQEEKALSLGRAGRAVEAALARLEDPDALAQEGREALLKAAAQAVWKFFIQREACGARDHRPVIAHYAIPRAVLARLGAM